MFPMMDPESVSMYCEFLAFLPAKADVLEWGLGGSTLFFPKYVEGGTWTTIEHDVQWAAKLQSHIDANPSTFPYLSKSRFEQADNCNCTSVANQQLADQRLSFTLIAVSKVWHSV